MWTFFGRSSANVNGYSHSIMTWQSWLLSPCSFKLLLSIHRLNLEANPSGSFMLFFSHKKNCHFPAFDRLNIGTGIVPSSFISKSLLLHSSGRSNLLLMLSFVFPGAFNNVFVRLSKKFFWIRMKSRLCRRRWFS